MHYRLTVLVGVVLGVVVPGVRADSVPVYGGPTADSVTTSGLFIGPSQYYLSPPTVAGEGIAGGAGNRFVNGGYRGPQVGRWNTAGAAVLPPTDPSKTGDPADGRVAALLPDGRMLTSVRKYTNGVDVGLRPVVWDTAGNVTEMAYLGQANNLAHSVVGAANASGVSVGSFGQDAIDSQDHFRYTVDERPVRWNAAGTVATPLGVLGTDSAGHTPTAYPAAINDAGTTVGTVAKYVGGTSVGLRAVRWDADTTTAVELPTRSANDVTFARKINTAGTIVGRYDLYTGTGPKVGSTAARWTSGATAPTLLDGMNTAVDGKYTGLSYAIDLNDAGTAVGVASASGSVTQGVRAVRWDAAGTAITVLGLLGTPTANTVSYAFDISNTGVAVGTQREGSGGDGVALLWGPGGGAIDLNTFIDPAGPWTLLEADSITDTGWVSGVGRYDPDGSGPTPSYNRAFLIQVPEPTGIGLLAVGAVAIRRRCTGRACQSHLRFAQRGRRP